jgi:hypothetical protein
MIRGCLWGERPTNTPYFLLPVGNRTKLLIYTIGFAYRHDRFIWVGKIILPQWYLWA